MVARAAELSRLVRSEFRSLELGDPRRHRRVEQIVAAIARDPSVGFPRAMESEADLEGFYRLLRSPYVSPEALLEPHAAETVGRCEDEPVVLVVQDTTEVSCSGEVERVGMGRLRGTRREGFLAHAALAVSVRGEALGVLGLECWTRIGPSRWQGSTPQTSAAGTEPARWQRMDELIDERFRGSSTQVIGIKDREGDQYDLFAANQRAGRRYVIRLTYDRRLAEGKKLLATLAEAPIFATFSADVAARTNAKKALKEREKNPARPMRKAELQARAATVELLRPTASQVPERSLTVNVVHAREVSPPEGQPPVEWLLITSEPITTEAGVRRVLQYYRYRWVIEEYFKALKTGCSLEKRQLESFFTYVRALALLAPVAWALLHLRDSARANPDADATTAVTPRQLTVLRAYKPRLLPAKPTAQQVLLAIASLGGHLKHNGPPGWATLGAGYEKLVLLEAGWAARDAVDRA